MNPRTRPLSPLLVGALAASTLTLLPARTASADPGSAAGADADATVWADAQTREAGGDGATDRRPSARDGGRGEGGRGEGAERLRRLQEFRRRDGRGQREVGGGRGEGWGGPWDGDRDAFRADLIAVARDLDPELADRLEAIDDPGGMRRALIGMRDRLPEMFPLMELRRTDPPMYAARVADLKQARRTEDLGRDYREAVAAGDEDLADELRDALEDAVEAHFDRRQELRELRLERLEAELEALEAEIDDRDDNKRSLIEARIVDLTTADTRF